jgi:hypothetical protein
MTNGASEARPKRAFARGLSEKFILKKEGFRAKIDMAKPQQAICHLFECRVSIKATAHKVEVRPRNGAPLPQFHDQ